MIDRVKAQDVNTILVNGKATMVRIEEAVRRELCRYPWKISGDISPEYENFRRKEKLILV